MTEFALGTLGLVVALVSVVLAVLFLVEQSAGRIKLATRDAATVVTLLLLNGICGAALLERVAT